jgi:hypothetical protein
MFVCCERCVLSVRGFCDELITLPEESYWLWCVVVCDLETSRMEEDKTRVGSQRHKKKAYRLLITRSLTYITFVMIITLKNERLISWHAIQTSWQLGPLKLLRFCFLCGQ